MPLSHVYDTYVKTATGRIMHFDVVLDEQDQDKDLRYAKEWLATIGHENAVVTQENCAFCHSAEAPPELRKQIEESRYFCERLFWASQPKQAAKT